GRHETGRPGRDVEPPTALRRDGVGPLPKRVEAWRNAPRRREPSEQRGRPVPQGGDAVTRGLAGRAVGEMALDLDALRPAQPLVEVGVKLLLRNVPHRSPFGSAAGRARLPDGDAPAPAWSPRRRPPGRSAPRFPDSSTPRPT